MSINGYFARKNACKAHKLIPQSCVTAPLGGVWVGFREWVGGQGQLSQPKSHPLGWGEFFVHPKAGPEKFSMAF